MDPVVSEFRKKTPIQLLDKQRQHTREVGYLIRKCAAKALYAAKTRMPPEKRSLWSEDSLLLTGSIAEGASLARMFSPDQTTSGEFEIDMMLNFFRLTVDEGLVRYVEKNEVFAHVQVDKSILKQLQSVYCEEADGVVCKYEGSLHLNSIHIKDWLGGDISAVFSNNPIYQFFKANPDLASRSASIPSCVDDLNSELLSNDVYSNTTAKHYELMQQVKSRCETFEITFGQMLKGLLILQKELTEMRPGEPSVSLHKKAAKAVEWAKACMEITDVIFDCRRDTLCSFVYKTTGIDLSEINGSPRDYIKQKLEYYINQLSTTTTGVTDPSVAASVCRMLDEIEGVRSKEFLHTFQQLVSDIRMFSSLASLGEQHPQLCQTPPSLEQLSGIIKRYSIDYVPCIQLQFWPSVAAHWKTRDRLWPAQSVVDETVSKGAHLVGKEFCHETLDWRLSFSVAEIDLASQWSPAQHFVYFVFKALFYAFIKPLSAHYTTDSLPTHATGKQYLTSYMAKTIMMWTSESVEQSWWTEDNAGECLTVLLLALQSAFETRTLQHYFVSSVNLLEDHPDILASSVVATIDSILADPAAVVDQLKSCFKKIEIFFNAMPEEEKQVRDIGSFISVVSSLAT